MCKVMLKTLTHLILKPTSKMNVLLSPILEVKNWRLKGVESPACDLRSGSTPGQALCGSSSNLYLVGQGKWHWPSHFLSHRAGSSLGLTLVLSLNSGLEMAALLDWRKLEFRVRKRNLSYTIPSPPPGPVFFALFLGRSPPQKGNRGQGYLSCTFCPKESHPRELSDLAGGSCQSNPLGSCTMAPKCQLPAC